MDTSLKAVVFDTTINFLSKSIKFRITLIMSNQMWIQAKVITPVKVKWKSIQERLLFEDRMVSIGLSEKFFIGKNLTEEDLSFEDKENPYREKDNH